MPRFHLYQLLTALMTTPAGVWVLQLANSPEYSSTHLRLGLWDTGGALLGSGIGGLFGGRQILGAAIGTVLASLLQLFFLSAPPPSRSGGC